MSRRTKYKRQNVRSNLLMNYRDFMSNEMRKQNRDNPDLDPRDSMTMAVDKWYEYKRQNGIDDGNNNNNRSYNNNRNNNRNNGRNRNGSNSRTRRTNMNNGNLHGGYNYNGDNNNYNNYDNISNGNDSDQMGDYDIDSIVGHDYIHKMDRGHY
jgi:hypothetical protein